VNNLIQELASQATIRVNNPIVNTDGKIVCDDWQEGISISKFAELLVKETISKMSQQLNAHGDNQANNPAYYKSINDTLKHFGVNNE
jgi:hypothetical protein